MIRYFIEGGPLFMGMLSIVLLVVLVLAIIYWLGIRSGKIDALSDKLNHIKSLGLFAFVLGMLGQFLGLFQAFNVIGQGMEISPRIFAMGLKVSSITSIYGMIIFLVSYLLWFALKALASGKS
jgi:biopolymer transport protein ExbB/TolQ